MNLTKIIEAIVSTEPEDIVLFRSFSSETAAMVITRRANELLKENPDMQSTIIALSIYPALKWSMQAKSVNDVMSRICDNDREVARLKNLQKIIVDVTATQPRLLLSARENYFKACDSLLKKIDDCVESIQDYPDNGPRYYDILGVYTGTGNGTTKYLANTHTKKALTLIHEMYGEELEELLNPVLTAAQPAEQELNYIHHNTGLLLKEYTHIVWMVTKSDDNAMRLLQCESEDEMLKITKRDEKYIQAYIIAEYIKLISGGIEMVKLFPIAGEEYHRIIKSIIAGKSQRLTDAQIAKQLDISTYSYSVKKRRALSVLGSVLWGSDADTFLGLLTESP